MTEFIIPADHPCLPGHFPDQPIVPGVVVLDRILAAIEAQHGALGALRMPQVKFLQPLLPEQTARIELQRLSDASDTSMSDAPPRWRFRVLRDEILIASGEVHAA